jgi:hypothetical protein
MIDPRLKRAGVSAFNTPKRTPSHPTKSHIVVAKEGSQVNGEYVVVMYSQSKTGEVVGTEPDQLLPKSKMPLSVLLELLVVTSVLRLLRVMNNGSQESLLG